MRTPRLRLLSALLAAVLFFTLLPVSALAEDSGSNANTGLTIGIVGNLNHWDESHSISMKEVSPAVYEVTFENKSYGDINGSVGFLFVKDNSWTDSWGFGAVSSGELHNAVYKGNYITINPGSDDERSPHNFIIRLDLTNWDWDTKMGATFTVTVAAATNKFFFDLTTGTITGYDGTDTVVVIPSKINGFTVETIGHTAFQKSAVTSVTIPDSVTAILDDAFANCSQLTNISIPNSVTSIGFSAFEHCTSLKSITLPSSLSSISEALFSGCSQLTTIQIPDSVLSIQDYAFYDCSALKTVSYNGSLEQWSKINVAKGFLGSSCPSLVMNDYTAQFIPVKDENDPNPPPKTVTITKYTGTESTVILPSTISSWDVTKIGEDAFQDNTTITSVTIPDSVTEIGSNAFAGCTNLTSVNYAGDWSNLTIQSGNPAVEDAAKDAANEQLFDFDFTPDNTAVIVTNYKYKGTAADVTIPSRYKGIPVTAIGYAAFFNSAVTSVTIPDSVTSILDDAFVNCPNLTNISIPNSVTSIGFSAFRSCTSLKSITLPSSLNSISEALFSGCSQLTTIHIPVSVTLIEDDAFAGCPSSMTVTYPGSKTQWVDDITKGSNNDVLENHLICAKLEATFTADGTTFAQPQTINRGEKFKEPAKPSKENHTFAGWYNGDEKFDFDADTTNAPNVLELVAKWDINKYTVKFVSNHGSFADQTIEHGKLIETDKLTIPEVEGYTFDGWYADDTRTKEFDFSTPITGDTTVYAKWEKNAPVLPDTYALNVSGAFVYVDGVDVTAPAGDTSLQLEKDASVRLVADPDRMPSGMVFDRWTILNGALNADDAEKFETGRTLEEFAFTMPAEPLSIEATPRMQEEEGSDTVSVIAGVTLGTAATALVAWQAYDLGMSLYQEHWLPADFVMPKTRAELALLLWNTAGRPAPAAQPAFTDIPDPDTAQAAQWAVETGLMTPKSADRFKPEKSVTRWKAVRSWKRVTNQNT